MFTSKPPTCAGRTLALPRKDRDIRYLRPLGNSDIAFYSADDPTKTVLLNGPVDTVLTYESEALFGDEDGIKRAGRCQRLRLQQVAQPYERIKIVGPDATPHDLTVPMQWLLSHTRAAA